MPASVSLARRICFHRSAAPEVTLAISRPKASFKVETLVWKRVQARRRHPASSSPGGGSGPDPIPACALKKAARTRHGPVRQPLHRQHRNRQPTIRTEITLHRQPLLALRLGIAAVTTVPVQAVGASAGTRRTVTAKTICSNLDALLKAQISAQKQFQNPAGTTKVPQRPNPPPSPLHPHGAFINVTTLRRQPPARPIASPRQPARNPPRTRHHPARSS